MSSPTHSEQVDSVAQQQLGFTPNASDAVTSPSVALLNASTDTDFTPANFRRVLDVPVTVYDVRDGDYPPLHAHDGVVVTGSRASVYDYHDWIADTLQFIEQVLAYDIPTLGVCWGHQAIAQVLGGTVEPMESYEIGYREINRTAAQTTLLRGFSETFTAYTTHSDRVTELPDGVTVTARNDRGIQAFESDGGDAFGVQFHPEYDMETARVVTTGKTDIDLAKQDDALQSITADAYSDALQATRLFRNFEAVLTGEDGIGGSD